LELVKSSQTARISNDNTLYDEQNVDILINLVNELFQQIPFDLLNRLKAIQVNFILFFLFNYFNLTLIN
jgi:hypothetical protein